MMSIILTEGLGYTDCSGDVVKVDEFKFKIDIPKLSFTVRGIDKLSFTVTIPTYDFNISILNTTFNTKRQIVKFKIQEG